MGGICNTRDYSADKLIGRLNREWDRLCADPGVQARLAGWARQDKALAGLDLATVTAEPANRHTDALFHALERRAVGRGADAELAGRIVLQCMLPKAVSIAAGHSHLFRDSEEATQEAVAAMYECIRTFPLRVTHHIPIHLAWESWRTINTAAMAQMREIPTETIGVRPATAGELHPSEELLDVLATAVREGVVDTTEADLLLERYSSRQDAGNTTTWKYLADLDQLARRYEVTPDLIRQRCSRVTRRLRRAADDGRLSTRT